MKTTGDLGTKVKHKILSRYPLLRINEVPTISSSDYIDVSIEEIAAYDPIFWHRLLRAIYQRPSEIECELHDDEALGKPPFQTAVFRRTEEGNSNWQVLGMKEQDITRFEAGRIKSFPINWRYFVRLPTGGVVVMGTKHKNTLFHVSHVAHISEEDSHEIKAFIRLLLEEAYRMKGQLSFNPKEFDRTPGVKLYHLFNVYLANYVSAEFMMGAAESSETELSNEFLRYDARTVDICDEEKTKHIDRFGLACGMFYSSAIGYFFMALEGFINIVFHAFLKSNLKDPRFDIEKRFDLEQKLRLLPSLCQGFDKHGSLPASLYERLKKLTNYRNAFFHAKAEDSLKSLCVVEDGCFYTYEMDNYKDQFLPSQRTKLTANDVAEVKSMVDEIIVSVMRLMDQDARTRTEKYILQAAHIPFGFTEAGDFVMGRETE